MIFFKRLPVLLVMVLFIESCGMLALPVISSSSSLDTSSSSVSSAAPRIMTGNLGGDSCQGLTPAIWNWNQNSSYENRVMTNGTNFTFNMANLASDRYYLLFLYRDLNSNNRFDFEEPYVQAANFLYSGSSLDLGQVAVYHKSLKITVNDAANAYSELYLFGTVDGTNRAALQFDYDTGSGIPGVPYAMYDDGTHGDDVSGDRIWTLTVDFLDTGYNDPFAGNNYFLFETRNAADSLFCSRFGIPLTNSCPLTQTSFTWKPALIADTVVVFSVSLSNTNLLPLSMGIRGDSYPLSWFNNSGNRLNDGGTNGDAVAGDNVWSGAVTFTNGSPAYFEYKFNAHDNDTGWEESIGNRSFVITNSGATNFIPLARFDIWN